MPSGQVGAKFNQIQGSIIDGDFKIKALQNQIR